MIKIVCINNPFEPMADRHVREAELAHPGTSLRDYLIDAQLDSPKLSVSVNGHVFTEAQQKDVIPLDGDCIVLVLRVGNSGIFKSLGAVAVLALATVVSGGLATGPLAALGAGALGSAFASIGLGGISAFGASLIAAGVTIGGNLLVSAIAGALTPASKTPSPSYDIDGPKSLAQSGAVIPKGYGKFMWGGNCISSFTEVEGQDSYINWLGCYGYGPVRELTLADITINGKPTYEYQNVQVILRLGTNDQTPIPNFNRIVNGYPQNTQCLAGIPVVIPGIGTETLIGQLDIQFPNGVFKRTKDGNTIPVVITYKLEYSPAGLNQWKEALTPKETVDVVSYDSNGVALIPHPWCVVATDLPPSSGVVYALDDGPHSPGDPWTGQVDVETFQPNGNHTTVSKTCTGEWQRLDPTLNQVKVTLWNAGYIDYVGASLQTLYNRTTIYYPSKAKWDLRVTKYGSALLHDDVGPGDNFDPTVGQDMWVHEVNEITPIDLCYPGMILIGVRALATSQLNGANLNVLAAITHGCRTRDTGLLPAQLAAYEDDNPAVVAADMMLDRVYGGGRGLQINPANIVRYIDEWVAWAELNDQLVDDGNGGSIRRHVYRGVIDTESTLWEQLNAVGAMSRAQILQFGKDYGVYVDQEDVPVQMFSMGNIGMDSFTEQFLELDARANQVEIQFADSTRYYKSDNPMVYMDPGFQDAGVVVKNARIRANGVVVPAQAWHLARFRERGNEFILRSGAFSCDVQAVACRPGNVIILQHDVPEWGWGGRTLLGCTLTKVVVDRLDLAFTPDTATSSVILIYPAILQYSGTVSAVANVVDSTGANVGTMLTLSSFDNLDRVVRAIVTNPGGNPVDCAIKVTAAGSVTVQPPPGFTPTSGATYELFDTDVLVSRAVASIDLVDGQQILTLASPLPQLPEDFSTYFFGPTGSQKLARVTSIKRQSEFRFKLEWADYDPAIYDDATPTFGSITSSAITNPGVTSLTGSEVFNQVGGSYIASVVLSWRNGPDTAGVGVYASYPSVSGRTLPQQIARLTGAPTSYTFQAVYGEPVQYTVVGFDSDDHYAGFSAAPSVTVAAVGVATNLLLGSNFASGFTYWNVTPRVASTSAPTLPTIRSLLTAGTTARVVGHLETWIRSSGTHPVDRSRWPGYDDQTPADVHAHVQRIKRLGIDVVMTNCSARGSWDDTAFQGYVPELNSQGVGLIVNIDQRIYFGTSSPVATIRDFMTYIRGLCFPLANYEKFGGKYIVTFFTNPADDASIFRTIEGENTDCIFAYDNPAMATSTAPNLYCWVTSDLAAHASWFLSTYGPPVSGQLLIPCAAPGFNDTSPTDSTKSVWSDSPARVWPAGGPSAATLKSYFDAFNAANTGAATYSYFQLVTINDWDEDTAIEQKVDGSGGYFSNPVSGVTTAAVDAFVPSLNDDGEANYTIGGSALTVAQPLLFQVVPPSKWTVGQYLMLSSYFRDSCVDPSAPNVGELIATLTFRDASNAEISHVDASVPLNGVTPGLKRTFTPGTQIPAGTAIVVVSVAVGGAGLYLPAGSVLSMSHLLLEDAVSAQSAPSEWADIDAAGHILSLFTTGSSLGLRVQGSVVPSFTGDFSFTYDSDSVTISWSNLVILWPDGGYSYIQYGSLTISGLASDLSGLMAYPYYDVRLGVVEFAPVATPLGSPGILSATADTAALAFCQQDNHVALSNTGLTVMTAASSGTGGSGSGGGSGGGGVSGGGDPIGSPSPIDRVL